MHEYGTSPGHEIVDSSLFRMLHQNHCPLVIFLFHGPWRKCELNVLSRSTENELARLASLNWIPLEDEKKLY